MGNKRTTKKALFTSAVALLLCISMLLGTTFAWFTDSVTSGSNIIQSGNLDIEMYWTDDLSSGTWHNVEEAGYNTIFSYDKWEPGYTDVKYIKLVNNGNLALNYELALTPQGSVGKLAEVINVYFADEAIDLQQREDLSQLGAIGLLSNVMNGGATASGTLLPNGKTSPLHPTGEVVVTIAMSMITTAGNEYQEKDSGKFTITALATQASFEKDSIGSDYDSGAEFPTILTPGSVSVPVAPVDGKVPAGGINMNGDGISAFVPEGVAVEPGADKLTLSVTPMENTTSDITVINNEILIPVDVHVAGVAEGNTVPIVVNLGEILPKYLNMGNYHLYHVEDGVNSVMTLVDSAAELTAHNRFTYDPLTGAVSVALASFSEVALLADTTAKWEGGIDFKWYNEGAQELVIANADQLYAFAKIVGGMADGYDIDDFAGQTVKLMADIDLNGGKPTVDGKTKVFYPIGYYNSTNKIYDREDAEVVGMQGITSSVSSFEGTFDGNGHTIANFYQNTWEMFGDYNNGYTGTPNYYKDAMGLFGYVYGGTVKNLTVKNFSSDGEFTPTGVIAAYAANATFENIAIVDCNPRVYNTGNGGIVGIGGNSDDPDAYKLTFNNITIDNTNKITALWGSWDVACGGLVGMFRGDGHVHMNNCHVAAQIDVYNDVCGNYQYYWYRYSGMLVGTNQNMITKDGKTKPETDKFHAENCTVHFGDWNDYYYCELVANSLASYTHDHQFSRLEQIQNVSEIQDANGNWTRAGNFILMNGKTPTETCYHIVSKNGALTEHTHASAGEETVDVNGDGVKETVLKENNQRIFLPFNQLFTGYGWGVEHVPIYDNESDNVFDGVTILKNHMPNSEQKFNVANTAKNEYTTETTITIGELFAAATLQNKVPVLGASVNVTVSPVGETSTADGKFEADTTDWTKGTLTFSGIGAATITIQDYYFCTPTTITVNITERQPVEKFDIVMNNGDFLHRVGNSGTVPLDKLFKAKNDVTVGTISVTVDAVDNTGASGTYSNNAIQFSGTGVVKVTITDNDYCIPTELYLEVVDAVNATTATSATKNNVVLLDNVGFGSLEVSGGYTLYGNGFTMTCGSDSYATDRAYSFVELNDGTLDNVKIVVPNFSHAIMYEKNKSENGNPSYTDSNGKVRYYNIRSAVLVKGNSKITNSYIAGGRAAIYATSGKLTIENSTIFGGAVANIQAEASSSLILEDVTLIQKPIKANVNDTSKTVMGLSVVMMCDTTGVGASVTLKGYLHQYAWANSDYSQYVPSDAQDVVPEVLNKKEFVHSVTYADGVTRDSVNLGFAYMPVDVIKTNADNMSDERSQDEKTNIPYDKTTIKSVVAIYTYKSTNGTDDAVKSEPSYVATVQSNALPIIQYKDTNENRVFSTSYDAVEGKWKATLKVDVDAGAYTFSFDKLLAQKYGKNLTYTVQKMDGTAVDKNAAITLNSAVSNVYILTITDNQIYEKDGNNTGKTAEATYIFELLSTKTSLPAPTWTSKVLDGTPYIVVDSKGGDWNCAVPVLDGLKVKYWSKKQNKEIELDLATVVSTAGLSAGLQNGSNNTITITVADEYTLTITTTGFKTNDNGKPVVVSDKLYFTVSSSSNYVSTKTTDRTISIEYSFTDANNSDPISLDTSMNVVYANYKSNQYKYSDFCNGKLTAASSGCVTGDTLVTLADGTQKRIEAVTYADQLLAWDFFKGEYAVVPAAIIFDHGYDNNTVIKLNFSDGTSVKVVNLHQFFDADLNKLVSIDADSVADYVGHKFAKQGGEVALVSYEVSEEYCEAWGIISAEHYNIFVEGMLSTDFMYEDYDLFNYFVVGDDMKFDDEKMQADIEKYGLYTYEDFAEYLTYEQFVAFNVQYFKIPVGKGVYTYESILALINTYLNN